MGASGRCSSPTTPAGSSITVTNGGIVPINNHDACRENSPRSRINRAINTRPTTSNTKTYANTSQARIPGGVLTTEMPSGRWTTATSAKYSFVSGVAAIAAMPTSGGTNNAASRQLCDIQSRPTYVITNAVQATGTTRLHPVITISARISAVELPLKTVTSAPAIQTFDKPIVAANHSPPGTSRYWTPTTVSPAVISPARATTPG